MNDLAPALERVIHELSKLPGVGKKTAERLLVELKDRYDIAFGNDTDFDRHGIVTPSVGLMNPNHYLAVAIDYLFRERSGWPEGTAIGKTLVSSSMIDRIARDLGRRLCEVPVGFKHVAAAMDEHDALIGEILDRRYAILERAEAHP